MQATQAQRAYQHLRAKLISGDYTPGMRIRYGPVGKELGISATPVREAMGQLANEGFVQLVPQLGAVVRKVSREQLLELYELREAIEPYAAAKAAERLQPATLEEIREQFQKMQELSGQVAKSKQPVSPRIIKEFEQADLTFHMLILEATGNQTMIRTVGNSHVLARIFETDRHAYDRSVFEATCADHGQILQALEQQDATAAASAMGNHIRNSLQVTLNSATDRPSRWWEA